MKHAIALIAAVALAQDARNVKIPNTDTHFSMPVYKSLAEWEARARHLRRQILSAAGLDPMPERTPLNPRIFGRIENRDYAIEKVLLETLPGYYLGGNLYRPLGKAGRLPGVVSPHGHWTYGRLEHQPLGSIPARCINLARQGYVVFAYDMVGYNDTLQTPHDFGGPREMLWGFGPLGLQLWNSIRAVDFVSSLPEVDPARMAATGASGGGTQTFLLTAVDDRVRYAAPVNMISAIMQGGSPCENAPNLRVGAFNVEIAALAAPRPLLMVSASGDWTRNTPREEFPAVRSIYQLYGRPENVETIQIDAPHNYNQASREAVYGFFAKHVLGEDPASPRFKERNIRLEKLQDMLALHGRTLPDNALSYAQLFEQWKRMDSPAPDRERLRYALAAEWPSNVKAERDGEKIVLTREGRGDRVSGLWFEGRGPATVVVDPDGAEAARSRVEAGRATLLLTVFQTGSAVAPRDRSHRFFLTFNKSDDAERVQDILTALAWLKRDDIRLVGIGRAAVWCLFAAAVAPGRVTLDAPLGDFTGADEDFISRFFVPGIQRAGGVKAAAQLAAR